MFLPNISDSQAPELMSQKSGDSSPGFHTQKKKSQQAQPAPRAGREGSGDRGEKGGGPRGHSPVWVRTWPCSSQGLEKAFPQVPQTQGSVWLRMCILRAPRLRYSLLQYLQLKAFRVWESLATESPASCVGNWPKPGKAA